jgi:hypothetical protein
VDKDLRASLVAAGAAAALSALVGIIAGVGFFALFLRALIGGLFLGAAVYGGIVVLRRSVPGILDHDENSAADAASELLGASDLGANVDIVLPGEEPEPDALVSDAEPFVAKLFPEGEADPGFVEEGSLLEPEEQIAEAEPAIPGNAGAEKDRRPSLGFDELDVLPDLDGFTDSFTASEFAFGGSSAERSDRNLSGSSSGGSSGSRAGQEGLDPATLAHAVQTILKRDQKG